MVMFGRVRRSDLVLAAIAVIGVVAGLVLTVAARIGVTGPVLIGVGIVAAATAAVSGVRAQVSAVVDRHNQQRDHLEALLAVPVRVLGEVDLYRVGVFPSVLAEAAQQNWAADGTAGTMAPPYVPRGVDEALRRAVEESSLVRAGRLVVLRGDPKSGKSRSLWEAVRVMPDRRLLAVIQPDPAADKLGPAAAPLATLAALHRPVSRCKGRDLVIWVDDAQAHLWRGLSRDTLRRLAALYPAAVIALTIHSSEVDGLRDIDPPLHDMLRRGFDDLLLAPTLSPAELEDARVAYPALADDDDLVRLPELFAAVDLLTDRYQHHRADEPAGVAVAKAAVDWQRAGMAPGSLDEPTLRALAELTLADIAPNQILDDHAFLRGLAWATKEVAAFAALVCREHGEDSTVRRFRAFDAVVSWAQDHDPPLGPGVWDFVLGHVLHHAYHPGFLGVGIAANRADAFNVAARAFEGATASADSSVAAPALQGMGLVLQQLGRKDDAITAFDQLIERFGGSDDPVNVKLVAVALAGKGILLGELGRLDYELAAYDEAVERIGGSDNPVIAESMAIALCGKGMVLGKLGRYDEAVKAFEQLVEQFGGSDNRVIAERVAAALVAMALELGELGRHDEAVKALDQVVKQFGCSVDPRIAVRVAQALAGTGIVLAKLGRLDDELAAYDELVERFGGSDDPVIAESVAMALCHDGMVLRELGRSDHAVMAFEQLVERFGGSDNPVIAADVASALVAKGMTLGRLDQADGELAAYDEVVERFGGSDDPVIATRVASALVAKGAALRRLGRLDDAVSAFDQVVKQFGGSAEPKIAKLVTSLLSSSPP